MNQAEGESADARIARRELCVSSMVEFECQDVVNLAIGDHRQRMAKCALVSGGCWGAEPLPDAFWTIVDGHYLCWETATPAAFNGVVASRRVIPLATWGKSATP